MSYRIIKPMIYQKERKIELLYDAPYRNYHFYILNLGTHPTAYVEIPKNHKFYGINYNDIDNIIVHGGLTYSADHLFVAKDKEIQGWFIGWDYAHWNDYLGYEENFPAYIRTYGKKWTTNEIIEECKNVINQIIDKVTVEDIIEEIDRVHRLEKDKKGE